MEVKGGISSGQTSSENDSENSVSEHTSVAEVCTDKFLEASLSLPPKFWDVSFRSNKAVCKESRRRRICSKFRWITANEPKGGGSLLVGDDSGLLLLEVVVNGTMSIASARAMVTTKNP